MVSCVVKAILVLSAILLVKKAYLFKTGEDYEDLCFTKPFNYTIQLPGCIPKVVENNFCYGLCRSFFYPKKRRIDGKTTSICPFCAPIVIEMKVIRLRCFDPQENRLRVKFKVVKIFKSCKCKKSLCETWPMYY